MPTKYFFFTLLLGVVACTSPPNYDIVPAITFKSFSKNVMIQGKGTEDSTYLTLGFQDGDGDIGDTDSLNVFVSYRGGNVINPEIYRMPFVPEQGSKNGISGDIRIRLFTTCCNVLPPCQPSTTKPIDTIRYQIYIKDRAGHTSNVVETTPMYLQCR
jgi:hypothetical protein